MRLLYTLVVSVLLTCPAPAQAAEWFVQAGANGTGSASSPFGAIQSGLDAAQPGDTVTVRPGGYAESLVTIRSGRADRRITLRSAEGRSSVLVSTRGTVLSVRHAYITVDGLTFDAQYAEADAVNVRSAGHFLVLRNTEVRRTTRDAVDIGAPEGVLIEDSLIHHALNAAGGRTDAHGVVAGAVKRLTVRGTEIHTFSGDAIQVDPGRSTPGWSDVVIEGCRLWLQPLPTPENGFAAGVVPGENALDTKADASLPRARIVIRDTVAYGFQGGLLANMAAFNLKENIDATVDGVTIHNSEIGFRVRGSGSTRAAAWVTVKNAVVHDTLTAVRYENTIEAFRVWNSTVGQGVGRAFRPASAGGNAPEVRNTLFVAPSLPAEASHSSNQTAGAESFVSPSTHNYALLGTARAVNAGIPLSEVTTDRQGVARPLGAAWDVGAFEFAQSAGGGSAGDGEIVLHTVTAQVISGAWRSIPDATAASRAAIVHPDAGDSRVRGPLRQPVDYFGLTFVAKAGQPYRLWIRGRAQNDDPANDAVFVQFSGSADKTGAVAYRMGTTSGLRVSLQDCSTCAPGMGLAGYEVRPEHAGTGCLLRRFGDADHPRADQKTA